MKHFYLPLIVIILQSCWHNLEYSPNQVFNKTSPTSINEKNIAWLNAIPSDDTITIAFVGDSQRFYDELHDFVDTVNRTPAIDFVLLAGDISDFGLLQEFEWIHELLTTMNKPYIGVIGNHDVLAKGDEVFERMYGPLNFSFYYKGVKFVAHNTNGKEFTTGNVPDMDWLRNEFQANDSVEYLIPVSHIPPYSADFDKNLERPYTALFRETPNVLISLHAHTHQFQDGYPYHDQVRYMTAYSFDLRSYVQFKIYDGKVEHKIIHY
jgi:3',5'-cyclic-AMP phosphodiesterase